MSMLSLHSHTLPTGVNHPMGLVSVVVVVTFVYMFMLFPVVLSHPFLIALLPKYVMMLLMIY